MFGYKARNFFGYCRFIDESGDINSFSSAISAPAASAAAELKNLCRDFETAFDLNNAYLFYLTFHLMSF